MSEERQALRVPPSGIATSAVDFVNQTLILAIKLNASDVHVESYQTIARLRYRLDGVLKEIQTNNFLETEYSGITTRIKVLAEIDIAEHRRPQDGRFSFSCEYGDVDIRVSVLPAVGGARMVLRIIGSDEVNIDFTALGINKRQLPDIENVLNSNQGMVLVTGPTGSGKTTTLYSMLNYLNNESMNILTVENPVERKVCGAGQVQICEEIGLDFSEVLRAFLRQDPEIIMIGEIRDFETADIAVKASLTGHLVLSTLHTNDALTAITRLSSLGISTELVSAAVNLVVSQRLVRITCEHCKTQDRSSDKVVDFLEGGSQDKIMHGVGCSQCSYTGYRGRRGIFEILRVDKDLCRHINQQGTIHLDNQNFVTGGTLEQSIRQLLLSGEVSFHEYQRIFLHSDAAFTA